METAGCTAALRGLVQRGDTLGRNSGVVLTPIYLLISINERHCSNKSEYFKVLKRKGLGHNYETTGLEASDTFIGSELLVAVG